MTGTPIPPQGPRAPLLAAPVPVRFPRGVRHWRGQWTGHYWALVPWPWSEHGYRLIEAVTEDALADEVRQVMKGTPGLDGGTPRAGGGVAAATPSPSSAGEGSFTAAAPAVAAPRDLTGAAGSSHHHPHRRGQ
ncbi:hypothetical protein [Actinomadura macra]|uniref:hypothetical protein n=1 Tax=Actinomadura macra TaxID=46164 RepID=UPI000B0B39CC|nr:hypothetical protein [Actinomadura macra]